MLDFGCGKRRLQYNNFSSWIRVWEYLKGEKNCKEETQGPLKMNFVNSVLLPLGLCSPSLCVIWLGLPVGLQTGLTNHSTSSLWQQRSVQEMGMWLSRTNLNASLWFIYWLPETPCLCCNVRLELSRVLFLTCIKGSPTIMGDNEANNTDGNKCKRWSKKEHPDDLV